MIKNVKARNITLACLSVYMCELWSSLYWRNHVLMSFSFGTKIPTLLGQLGSQLIVKRLETVAFEAEDR